VLCPVVILQFIKRSQRRHDASLAMKSCQVDDEFDKASGGGGDETMAVSPMSTHIVHGPSLGRAQMLAFLEKIGSRSPKAELQRLERYRPTEPQPPDVEPAAPPGDRGAEWRFSRGAFRQWYLARITVRVGSPFDPLYGGTAAHAPAWFIEVLLLKLAINAFYTARLVLEWHVGVNGALMVSGCILLLIQPYGNIYDLPMELSCMLALGCAVHLDTYRAADKLGDHTFIILACCLVAVPLLFFARGKYQVQKQAKADREARVATTRSGRVKHRTGAHDFGIPILDPAAIAEVRGPAKEAEAEAEAEEAEEAEAEVKGRGRRHRRRRRRRSEARIGDAVEIKRRDGWVIGVLADIDRTNDPPMATVHYTRSYQDGPRRKTLLANVDDREELRKVALVPQFYAQSQEVRRPA
jgi:hypothetical protein